MAPTGDRIDDNPCRHADDADRHYFTSAVVASWIRESLYDTLATRHLFRRLFGQSSDRHPIILCSFATRTPIYLDFFVWIFGNRDRRLVWRCQLRNHGSHGLLCDGDGIGWLSVAYLGLSSVSAVTKGMTKPYTLVQGLSDKNSRLHNNDLQSDVD